MRGLLFRLELGQLGSAMASLRAEHEENHEALVAGEAAASQLQKSAEEVETLRSRQADLAESIDLMQSLLEVGLYPRLQLLIMIRAAFNASTCRCSDLMHWGMIFVWLHCSSSKASAGAGQHVQRVQGVIAQACQCTCRRGTLRSSC